MQFSNNYLPKSLSRRDKTKQRKELKKSKKNYRTKKGKAKYYTRAKIKSYKNKSSSWTQQFHKLYPNITSYKDISKATGIPQAALKAVVRKGKGAYFSSGSRPNQTATSWGKARLYSYILGGKTRNVDKHITIKYGVKFKHRSKKS